MARINSNGLPFSTRLSNASFLYPIFFTIIISMVLVQLILLVNSYQERPLLSLQKSFTTSTILNLLVVSVLSAIVLFILFRIRKIRNKTAAKALIAMFIEGGMLAILLFGKLLFISLGLETPIFLIFVAVVAYIGTYFAFLAFVDSLSQKARNRLFVISSGSLGSFLGLLIPILPVIGISIILAITDIFLIQTAFFQRMLGEAKHEKIIIEMAFSTNEWGIGIGDLICYSMIVSSTSANYGIVVGSLSLLFILTGALLTMKLTAKQRQVPGLPIATTLGLLPSILVLIL